MAKVQKKKVDEMMTDQQKEATPKTTPRERTLAQPEGSQRAEPGTKGEGDYFRIIVRSKE
jgi:hypothetical protein